MRHGAGSLLPLRKEFFGFAHFRALQMANFYSQVFNGGGDDGQDGKEHGVAVAWDDLGGMGFRRQSQPRRHMVLHTGIDIGKGANSARYGAGGDVRTRAFQAAFAPFKNGIMPRQFNAECRGLCMDAMAAANGQSFPMFVGAGFERCQQFVQIL